MGEDPREQIRFDLEQQFRKAYRKGVGMIAGYYAVLIPYYLVAYSSPIRYRVVLATGVSLLLLVVCLELLRSERLHARHFQLLGLAAMSIITVPILLQLSLTGMERHHVEMGLILVADALIFHDLAYFLAAQITASLAWSAVILRLPGDRLSMGLGVISALIVGLTAHLVLRSLLRNQEELRFKDLMREKEKDSLHADLAQAFENVRTLRGLVPICSHCKKIRDDGGFWQKVETYVEDHSHAEFTHGVCPECELGLRAQFEAAVPETGP